MEPGLPCIEADRLYADVNLARPDPRAESTLRPSMFRQFNVLDALQLRLVEFYGGYRPRAFVASNGNSQAVKFIQPEILYCASDPIGQDDGLADELS